MSKRKEMDTIEKIKVKNYFTSKTERERSLKMSEVVAKNINRNDGNIDNQRLA